MKVEKHIICVASLHIQQCTIKISTELYLYSSHIYSLIEIPMFHHIYGQHNEQNRCAQAVNTMHNVYKIQIAILSYPHRCTQSLYVYVSIHIYTYAHVNYTDTCIGKTYENKSK